MVWKHLKTVQVHLHKARVGTSTCKEEAIIFQPAFLSCKLPVKFIKQLFQLSSCKHSGDEFLLVFSTGKWHHISGGTSMALHRLVTHSSFSSPACGNGVNTPPKKSSSRNAWVFFKTKKELPRKQIFWKVGWLFSPEFNSIFGGSGNLVFLFLAHYQTAKDCISQGLLGLVKHPTLTAN